MKVLVTGNLGYIGPVLGKGIKRYFGSSNLVGLDSGIFIQCTTNKLRLGDTYYDSQIFKDIRKIQFEDVKGFDAVVSLAAVSNDPIGKDFEEATNKINYEANLRLAEICSSAGVSKFIFASSCSMYGAAGATPKKESDITAPITAYAKSKIGVESTLKETLANKDIKLIFLRFATACGVSDRLRLDLVLNDFVASAVKYKKISILSDGSPWRPLIDTEDMANSIIWAIKTNFESNKPLSINVGCNEWNFQVSDLAKAVSRCIDGTTVEINKEAIKDNRSYKVDFSLYKSISNEFYPSRSLDSTIMKLERMISEIDLPSDGFRQTQYIRLNHVNILLSNNKIDRNLYWI